jgi:hypothetical protein
MARKSIGIFALTLIAVIGCGSTGSTDTDGGEGDSGATPDGQRPGDAAGDATGLQDSTTACPASEPAAGTPCSTTGLCVYGESICCGPGFQCTDGTWQVVYATCACPAPAKDAATDGKAADGGTCPASCRVDTDCNSCPQQSFGGWSCNGGTCQFMG